MYVAAGHLLNLLLWRTFPATFKPTLPMNDPGLEDVIQDVEDGVVKPPQHGGHRDPRSKDQPVSIRISNNRSRQEEKQGKFDASDRESDQEEEEDPGIYQPT